MCALIEKEYEISKKHGLPVTYLTGKEIKKIYGFETPCALMNEVSTQIDAYRTSSTLLDYHMKKHGLKLYTHTKVTTCKKKGSQYELEDIK